MSPRNCLLALLWLFSAWMCGTAHAEKLAGPVDLQAQWRAYAGSAQPRACPVVRALSSRLESIGFYNDPKNSVIDPKLHARDMELLADARAAEQALADAVTDLIRAPASRRGEIAGCALRQLIRFPRDRAFLDTEGRSSTGAARLFSVTPAFAYLVLRDAGMVPPEAEREILFWIREFAIRLEAWQGPIPYGGNVLDWTHAGLALAAVALGDRPLLERAIDGALAASALVSPEGTLANEMARGDMAMGYSLFSAQALSITIAVAKANGRDLLAEPAGAGLRRLFDAMTQSIVDPAEFVRRGGSLAATRPDKADAQSMGFLLIWWRATGDPLARNAACARDRLESFRIGGDWFYLFAEPSLCQGIKGR